MGFKTYTCPIAKECGGCEWLAVPYPIQLRRKQEWVEKLFAQVIAEDAPEVAGIVGMDEPLGYRFKAASPYAPGPSRKQRHGHGRAHMRSGFYATGSHRIVRCDACLVEAPGAREILNDVARVADQLDIPAYSEDRGTGVLRHAVVRCGYATGDILLAVVTNGSELPKSRQFVAEIRSRHPEITSIVQNVNTRRTNAILGRESHTLFGPGVMHDKLLGCTFEIGPTSFYQTNPSQTERLYQLAIDGANLHEGAHVLDAYCGTGTIGICAAAAARQAGINNVQVTGVEQVGNAVDCARRNAQANKLGDACAFVRADATDYMAKLANENPDARAFDTIILDPPRAGSTPEFLHGVVDLAPARVVYVSCNPETQVRDLAVLRGAGYRVINLTSVDMFPHTKHVEMVVTLERR
jgi:23S rRNA (uracil-5-)-methyltransferase RumA